MVAIPDVSSPKNSVISQFLRAPSMSSSGSSSGLTSVHRSTRTGCSASMTIFWTVPPSAKTWVTSALMPSLVSGSGYSSRTRRSRRSDLLDVDVLLALSEGDEVAGDELSDGGAALLGVVVRP